MFAPPCNILYISTTFSFIILIFFFFFFFFFYQKLKDLKHIVIRDIMENTSALSTRIFHNFSNDDMKKIMFQMSRMYTRVLKKFSRQFLIAYIAFCETIDLFHSLNILLSAFKFVRLA